jgi:TRAP-type C4-dicarboxylate transport system permease large subunit
MRPGYSDASVPNCSAITSGAWFGSMIPPEPTRIVCVAPATWPITTAVAALAIPGMLWCSASQ